MKTLIAVPCMDMVHTLFFKSFIGMETEDCEVSLTLATLIYDARNKLAQKAVFEGFDRVLWLDSDMVFDRDLFHRLSARLDEGYEYVSGLYFSRRTPTRPVIYSDVYMKLEEDCTQTPTIVPYANYPKDSVFEIAASGFGGVMMTTELIRDVGMKFGLPFSPAAGFGEDFSFCIRAREAGHKMYCDSSIKLGHIANIIVTEESYGQQ